MSTAVEVLLGDAPSPEVQHLILQAGCPSVLAALVEVEATPARLGTYDEKDAILLGGLLTNKDALVEALHNEKRPDVLEALCQNTLTAGLALSLRAIYSPVPSDVTSEAELSLWAANNSTDTLEFHTWLITSSPDPVSYLKQYAQGKFGPCLPLVFFALQHHEDVMTLDLFATHLPKASRRALLARVSATSMPFEVSLVRFLQQNQYSLPYGGTYTPAALALLVQSSRLEDQAVALTKAEPGSSPQIELYRSLPPQLQGNVLVLVDVPEHQVAYVPYLEYADEMEYEHDPVELLRSDLFDFPARLRLLCWADPLEIIDHLLQEDYTVEELTQVAALVHSDVPRLCTVGDWIVELNQHDDTEPTVAALVEYTSQHARGLVASTLEYREEYEDVLGQRVRAAIFEYCGGSVARWESVLSMGPSWEGTLPALLECVDLTEATR